MTAVLPPFAHRREVVPAYRHPLVWVARDLSLTARSGQVGVLTRTATKAVADSFSVNRTVNHSQPGWDASLGSVTALDMGAAEHLQWDCSPTPAAMSGLLEFYENGSLAIANAGVFAISTSVGADPRLVVYALGSQYRVYHHNGTSAVENVLSGTAPTNQQRVRLRWWLYSDGRVQIWQSIDLAAETTSGTSNSLALAAAWSSPTVARLNSQDAVNYGSNRFLGCVVMMGNQSQSKLLEALV